MNITISENFYDVSKIPKNWTKTRLKYALSFSENKSSNFNDEEILVEASLPSSWNETFQDLF